MIQKGYKYQPVGEKNTLIVAVYIELSGTGGSFCYPLSVQVVYILRPCAHFKLTYVRQNIRLTHHTVSYDF